MSSAPFVSSTMLMMNSSNKLKQHTLAVIMCTAIIAHHPSTTLTNTCIKSIKSLAEAQKR